MKAFAGPGPEGVAQGPPGERFALAVRDSGCDARSPGEASAPARWSQEASRAPGRRPPAAAANAGP